MKYMLVNGSFQRELFRELSPKTWIPWSSQRMTYFFARFLMNRQLAMIIATQPLDRGIQKKHWIIRSSRIMTTIGTEFGMNNCRWE